MSTVARQTDASELYHVRHWVRDRLGLIEHERRVAQIAAALFDLTRPLHGLGADARRLLIFAAFVHDVGRALDDDDHPRLGARMLLRDETLHLHKRTRRRLAYLTLYHRGRVPVPGTERILKPRIDDVDELRTILALLRAADALDGRQLESPKLLFALHDRRLRIDCYLESDCAKALRTYRRRKKFKLLEEVLDCEVTIDVHRNESLRLVA